MLLFSVSYRSIFLPGFFIDFFIEPVLFHLSINFIFSQIYISHCGCEKYSNLWCSDKWKIDLQVKKLKIDIFATPRKNSVTGPYHHPQDRQITLSPS